MSKSSYAKIFGGEKKGKNSKYNIKLKKAKPNTNIFGDPIKKKKKKKKHKNDKDIDKLIVKAINGDTDLLEVLYCSDDPDNFISVTNLKSSNIEPGIYTIGIPSGNIKLTIFIVREEDNIIIYLTSGNAKLEECLDGISEDEPIINYVAKVNSDILSTIIINQSED